MVIATLGWLAVVSGVVGGGEAERERRVAWVAEHAFPFDAVEAGNGFEDLAPLRDIIGDARIVSLGEATHGSREIFQMKHRLVEFLASELGFSIFAIEASMPESYRVGDWVRTGEGDPHERIEGMYSSSRRALVGRRPPAAAWHTQEVLDMVKWMRAFNASDTTASAGPCAPERREQCSSVPGTIAFTGFDMQTPDLALLLALDFVAVADPDFAEEARGLYDGLASTHGGGKESGVVTGTLPVEHARGKRLRLSGDVKTELIQGFAGLWCRVDGPGGTVQAFDNMQGRAPRGKRNWARYALELHVPEDAHEVHFGMLMGRGMAWFDTVTVELDGEPFADPTLFDFGFDGPTVKGFSASTPSYSVALDATCSTSGSQSLGMTYCRSVSQVTPGGALERALQVLRHLEASRERYLRVLPANEVDWGIQNARVVVQCMQFRVNHPVYTRDRSMADNVEWILEQNPGARIVLWAHNGHVSRSGGRMGGFLDERFGADHVVLGSATARGSYWAVKRPNALNEPPGDSFEALLLDLDEPRLVLDLRTAVPSDPRSRWLCEPLVFRSIGAVDLGPQFFASRLAREYDAIVYLRDTTPVVPLAWMARR